MKTPTTPFDPNTALLNGTQLAAKLGGRDRRFVTAMKHAGFRFDLGGYTTLTRAMQWLENNPGFRPPPRRKPKLIS